MIEKTETPPPPSPTQLDALEVIMRAITGSTASEVCITTSAGVCDGPTHRSATFRFYLRAVLRVDGADVPGSEILAFVETTSGPLGGEPHVPWSLRLDALLAIAVARHAALLDRLLAVKP